MRKWSWIVVLCLSCGGGGGGEAPKDVVEGVVPDGGEVICKPKCDGKQCGPDGCGGICGKCNEGEKCDANGKCVPDVNPLPCCQPKNTPGCPEDSKIQDCVCAKEKQCCVGQWDASCVEAVEKYGCGKCCQPQCEGKECGDDGCGGECGKCPSGKSCDKGKCVACSCEGKECGDDGCGKECGKCPAGKACSSDYKCVEVGDCGICWDGLKCGADPQNPKMCAALGCAGIDVKGKCEGDILLYCDNDMLYSTDCVFLSEGKKKCGYDEKSKWYDCVCKPQCEGKECGSDGCGGTCGSCGQGKACKDGKCVACTPQCSGKQCGPDGCDGVCGSCPEGKACDINGKCVEATECGACYPGLTCNADDSYKDACSGTPCQDITYEGKCFGDMVVFCEDDVLYSLDCGFLSGGTYGCGYDPEYEFYDCMCKPSCAGKECGDDGCGGKCGQCGEGKFCDENNKCQTCSCAGKVCGDDGCGKSCGKCPEGKYCAYDGQCKDIVKSACCSPSDQPGCKIEQEVESCVCKKDDYCCKKSWDSMCVEEIQEFGCGICCIPQCSGKQCGDDGCGGTCGICPSGSYCSDTGTCLKCSCGTKKCGKDQCGNSCGTCEQGYFCDENTWTCKQCSCTGLACGDDGCGKSCGTCPQGFYCNWEKQCKEAILSACCEPTDTPGCELEVQTEQCVCKKDEYCCTTEWDSLCVSEVDEFGCGVCCLPDCKNKECGSDGCGGSCGECSEGKGCLEGKCVSCGCGSLECGKGPCGENCGKCQPGFACIGGKCQQGVGSCCEPKQTPGCSDPQIAGCVCAKDSYCCDVKWDSQCVSEVKKFGCGSC